MFNFFSSWHCYAQCPTLSRFLLLQHCLTVISLMPWLILQHQRINSSVHWRFVFFVGLFVFASVKSEVNLVSPWDANVQWFLEPGSLIKTLQRTECCNKSSSQNKKRSGIYYIINLMFLFCLCCMMVKCCVMYPGLKMESNQIAVVLSLLRIFNLDLFVLWTSGSSTEMTSTLWAYCGLCTYPLNLNFLFLQCSSLVQALFLCTWVCGISPF